MAETPTDMLVAGYPDIDGAAKDFEPLGALVRDTQVWIDGVILMTHAPDGHVEVRQTCGNLGREGSGGGGIGFAVGLVAPPLLAGVAVGAVTGGVTGKFAGHRVEQDIHGRSDSQGERYEPESSRH